MPTNDFLPFCPTDTGTNLETQIAYAADIQRTTGNQPGIASSKLVNKALRQAAWIASQFAQYVVNVSGQSLLDDQNSTNALAAIAAALTSGVNVVSKTSAYTAAMKDFVIMSSASWSLTLPDASAAGAKGLTITLEHNGTSLTQVYTILTTSSQTLNGPGGTVASGAYKLYTNGESLTVTSDGANWQVSGHRTSTGSISGGANILSATQAFVFTWTGSQNVVIGDIYQDGSGNLFTVAASTNTTTGTFSGPTSPAATGTLTLVTGSGVTPIAWTSRTTTGQPVLGTTSTNAVSFSRLGRYATVSWKLVQTGAGTGGSQDYIFYLPPGLVLDTTIVPAYPTGPNTIMLNVAGAFASMVPGSCAATQQSASCLGQRGVAYSTTSFRFTGGTTSANNMGSGNLSLAGANIGWDYTITIPVLGWQP